MSGPELLVKGGGHYVDDITLPHMCHMAVVRSPHARAKVLSVTGGMHAHDLRVLVGGFGEGARSDVNRATLHPVFAADTVNYVGQPVAAVFAADGYAAEDKLDEVDVAYEKLRPIMTIDEALSGPPLHAGTSSNVIKQAWIGDDFVDPASPVVLEDEFIVNRIANNPLEPRGIVADYNGNRLTAYISTQAVFSMKRGLCNTLKLPPADVRVVQADTGGAFGVKSALYPEYVMAAHAAMTYRRPVKWIESRSEHLAASQPGRGVRAKMQLFAGTDGRIDALRADVVTDAGAFGGTTGSSSPFFIAMQLTGPYGITRARVRATSVMTNKPPQGPYRGAGRPEAAFFMERMMDALADAVGKGADEVRLTNTTTTRFTSPLGLEIDASRPFFTKAVTALRYKEKAGRDSAGLCFFVLVPGVTPGESARIRVRDGAIAVWLGGNQHGQAHGAFVKRLLSEELGVAADRVTLNAGDSDALTSGVGTWGSRSAIVGGAAVVAAARKVKAQVAREHGTYTPDALLGGSYDAEVFDARSGQLNSFGANLAAVHIDRFGQVAVRECAAYYDVGRALTPGVVRGQIVGGSVQGIGQVLYEAVVHDADGNLLTKDLFDAGLPIAENAPEFSITIVEHPSPFPHKAKGLGEAPTIGVPPAVVRAIENVSGVKIRHTPVTPEELIEHAEPSV
ncbi:MAG TPA: xanthine dehydrogenase family protein molybdopterin-binding subunit [Candidatus Bathyarchaeia archaeon]|nr:xanthine dehydrogenase family protein molybdopterin-binding subunit [Candidatus Bathyarchaeia archaeon]